MHASLEQQAKAAKHMETIIGLDNIYFLPENWTYEMNLPSPEDLKYKFLLKIKGNPKKKLEMLLGKKEKGGSTLNTGHENSKLKDYVPLKMAEKIGQGTSEPDLFSRFGRDDADISFSIDKGIDEHDSMINKAHIKVLKASIRMPKLFKRKEVKRFSLGSPNNLSPNDRSKSSNSRDSVNSLPDSKYKEASLPGSSDSFSKGSSTFRRGAHNSQVPRIVYSKYESRKQKKLESLMIKPDEVNEQILGESQLEEEKAVTAPNLQVVLNYEMALNKSISHSGYSQKSHSQFSRSHYIDIQSMSHASIARSCQGIEDEPSKRERLTDKLIAPDSEKLMSSYHSSLGSYSSMNSHFENYEKEAGDQHKTPKKYKPFMAIESSLLNMVSLFGQKYKEGCLLTASSCASINNEKFESIYKKTSSNLVGFTKRHFLRVYPSPKKIDSSNPDPVKPWTVGSQLFALNFQTPDEPMLINTCMFLANGGDVSGYVLKPKFLRSTHSAQVLPQYQSVKYEACFRLISGQMVGNQKELSKLSKVEPFVKFQVRGVEADEKNNSVFTSKQVENNGFNPIWQSEEFKVTVRCPKLFFLIITVYGDKSGSKLSWMCLPFKSIRPGIRAVPLYDPEINRMKYGKLLIKVKIKKLEKSLIMD